MAVQPSGPSAGDGEERGAVDSSENGVCGPDGPGMAHPSLPRRRRRRKPLLTALKIIGVLAWAGLWIATIGWIVGW